MKTILASASPRRQELIRLVCPSCKCIPADIDEVPPDGELPVRCAEYIAKMKAEAVSKTHPDDIVIGCDTTVIVDDIILGKPEDASDAIKMLTLLSGKTHMVVTGVSIRCGENEESFSDITEVEFYPLNDEEILDYAQSGEPMDKAGGYGIQGKGSLLVKRINGDFYNVVGLPVARLKRELDAFTARIEQTREVD